ncbi:P-loop containing nucleoside triphosphate hydrolase protein [Ascodesmis nigricans]|uniref:P-loop containing nucleoside triphosphate hydrolase protein n=1 Tax=Ascodesmis nigricans TaxID=341454 RepID=A0A4S2MWX4_9PEZI|nr:P-loop containing nucleoside triphosphate hydrolase protein [Ascodesmis nigricans]
MFFNTLTSITSATMIRSQHLCRRAHAISPRVWTTAKSHRLTPVRIRTFQQIPSTFTAQQGNIGLIQLRCTHDDHFTRISNAAKDPKPIGLNSETSDSEVSSERVRSLPPPTAEQKKIIDHFTNEESNMIITACPGGGKTSIITYLAQARHEWRFRFMTYNNQLAKETEERCKIYGVSNMGISTIHAAGYNHYSIECRVDQGLTRVLLEDRRPLDDAPPPEFDTLIIDEAQDLTPVMFEFIKKFLSDHAKITYSLPNAKIPRIILLGDTRQVLYDYKHASSRFLTLAHRPELLGKVNPYKWTTFSMETSKRLTPPMTDFINECLLNSTQMDWKIYSGRSPADRPFQHPGYLIVSDWDGFCKFLIDKMKTENLQPDEIMILSPSVRNNQTVRQIVNFLAFNRIPVSVPDSDHAESNHQAAKGKILATTYHQSKGLERKVVFVLGFDGNYPVYYGSAATERLTSQLLVAVTRASEQLYMVADGKAEPFKWISETKLESYCNIQVIGAKCTQSPPKDTTRKLKDKKINITGLLYYIPNRTLTECFSYLSLELVHPPGIASPQKSLIDDSYRLKESVAAITGTAAISFFQIHYRKKFTMLTTVDWMIKTVHKEQSVRYKESITKFRKIQQAWTTKGEVSIGDVLFVAGLHNACSGGFYHKLLSIPDDGYTWITPTQSSDMADTIGEHLPKRGGFIERTIAANIPIESLGLKGSTGELLSSVTLVGAPDFIMDNARWIVEIKNTEILEPKDILQTVLYATIALHDTSEISESSAIDEPWTLEVLNIRTGMIVRVKTIGNFRETCLKITHLLIKHYSKQFSETVEPKQLDSLSVKEFLEQGENGFKDWIGQPVLPHWLFERPEKSKWELREERKALRNPGKKTMTTKPRMRKDPEEKLIRLTYIE